MKKRILSFLALCLFSVLLVCPAFAADTDHVSDEAGILTSEQCAELNTRAGELSEQYQCGVYVITVSAMEGSDAYEYAKSVYLDRGLGYGSEKSGLLLLLSMESRDYALIAYGYGNTAFTDHGKDVMLDDNILPLLKEGEYYEAFSKYLDVSGEYLKMAREGSPFDVNTDPGSKGVRAAIAIVIPLVIALAVCLVFVHQMKTAVPQRTANAYITKDGMHLTQVQDLFLYQTIHREVVEDSSNHHGGTTIDSGGFSGRSGKF